MPEDKRIRKTKRLLKQTLIDMLSESTFEQITVKSLCERAEVSRITFYTHYNDKFDLTDEIFIDMVEIARVDYYKMQENNNLTRDSKQSYLNLLDAILNLFYEQNHFLRYAVPGKSPYLYAAFYKHIMENLEYYISKPGRITKLKYPPLRTAAFITNGIWNFISQAHEEGISRRRLCKDARELFSAILESKALFK